MSQRVRDRRRADLLLQEQGLAPSRTRAQALIAEGRVAVDGQPVVKPGQLLAAEARLTVAAGDDFVSRGGRKLEGALAALAVDVAGAVAADVGASTGGFTDCLLRRGAARVYAVDVGAGQLAASLQCDARVIVRDRTNARDLGPGDFPEPLDLVVVDASFIGIEKLAPALARMLPVGGTLLALLKPQFQVGPEIARRTRGVVREASTRERAIALGRTALLEAGFRVLAEHDSDLPGPGGNVERFLLARRE